MGGKLEVFSGSESVFSAGCTCVTAGKARCMAVVLSWVALAIPSMRWTPLWSSPTEANAASTPVAYSCMREDNCLEPSVAV